MHLLTTPTTSRALSPATARGRARPGARALLGAAAVATIVALPAGPAGGQGATTVTAQGVALQPSASCRFGDVDVTYAAVGAQAQAVTFSAADGATLATLAGPAYLADYTGTEHVLTEADAPPPAGSLVAVHVAIGTDPPEAATTGEFFVLYRCDDQRTDQGGANVVLATCVGPFGTCPSTAADAVAGFEDLVPAPDVPPPAPSTVARPLFTG